MLGGYARARDEDICPLRLTSRHEEILARVSRETSTTLVDAAAAIADQSMDKIPGNDWYLDHVHPNIGGHQLIARALAPRIRDLGMAARCLVGLVTHPQSFGIGIISHKIPAIAVRACVKQKIFSHETLAPELLRSETIQRIARFHQRVASKTLVSAVRSLEFRHLADGRFTGHVLQVSKLLFKPRDDVLTKRGVLSPVSAHSCGNLPRCGSARHGREMYVSDFSDGHSDAAFALNARFLQDLLPPFSREASKVIDQIATHAATWCSVRSP